jgi:hypothetical protein
VYAAGVTHQSDTSDFLFKCMVFVFLINQFDWFLFRQVEVVGSVLTLKSFPAPPSLNTTGQVFSRTCRPAISALCLK